ncbi:nuclear transport factor 2 family protein [Zavarzinia compransoris]|uniref:Nuclear transport factor 2 family protein n=2 Tax=Zavarzinia compransoris TaxID=1264899 RepID=A0A317ECT2_9PROT|nr:nuclear transport factor 2 family protein [Zavarzinia compransoris]
MEGLRADTVATLGDVMAPDIRFRDPFNAVTGLDRVQRIFSALFEDCDAVRFSVGRRFRDGEHAVLAWTMAFRLRRYAKGPDWTIEGLSEITLDPASGLVVAHVDHWDAAGQFYERLPLVGGVLRLLRRRLAH